MAYDKIKQNYKDIADAIREKTGEEGLMTAEEMPEKISEISGLTDKAMLYIDNNGNSAVKTISRPINNDAAVMPYTYNSLQYVTNKDNSECVIIKATTCSSDYVAPLSFGTDNHPWGPELPTIKKIATGAFAGITNTVPSIVPYIELPSGVNVEQNAFIGANCIVRAPYYISSSSLNAFIHKGLYGFYDTRYNANNNCLFLDYPLFHLSCENNESFHIEDIGSYKMLFMLTTDRYTGNNYAYLAAVSPSDTPFTPLELPEEVVVDSKSYAFRGLWDYNFSNKLINFPYIPNSLTHCFDWKEVYFKDLNLPSLSYNYANPFYKMLNADIKLKSGSINFSIDNNNVIYYNSNTIGKGLLHYPHSPNYSNNLTTFVLPTDVNFICERAFPINWYKKDFDSKTYAQGHNLKIIIPLEASLQRFNYESFNLVKDKPGLEIDETKYGPAINGAEALVEWHITNYWDIGSLLLSYDGNWHEMPLFDLYDANGNKIDLANVVVHSSDFDYQTYDINGLGFPYGKCILEGDDRATIDVGRWPILTEFTCSISDCEKLRDCIKAKNPASSYIKGEAPANLTFTDLAMDINTFTEYFQDWLNPGCALLLSAIKKGGTVIFSDAAITEANYTDYMPEEGWSSGSSSSSNNSGDYAY